MTRTLKWSYVGYFRHWFIILLLWLEQFLAPQLRIFLWKQGKLHSTVKTVYIISSNHTCRPMRAHEVSQLFYKFKLKRSTRKVLFKQLGDVCLISQMYANYDNTNDSIKLLARYCVWFNINRSNDGNVFPMKHKNKIDLRYDDNDGCTCCRRWKLSNETSLNRY